MTYKGYNSGFKEAMKFKPFLEPDEKVLAENIVFDSKGRTKRFGYKSLRGLFQVLKRANKNLLKHNAKMQYQIILPIKEK